MNYGLRKLKSCTNKLTISKEVKKMYVVLCADKSVVYFQQKEKSFGNAMGLAVAASKMLPKKKIIIYDDNTGEVIFELADR